MRPAPFSYERVETVEEMVEALGGADDEPTMLLAGGQSLIPRMNARAVRPRRVVDIDAVADLDHLVVDGDLRVGALCRHAALETADLAGPWAALRTAASQVGLHPIRVRGTLGGSLAHADPAAELALAAVTFDAEITVRSLAGDRRLRAEDFFLGPHVTALRPTEAIVEARFPEPAPGTVSAFAEVSRRVVGWPVAAVCVVLEISGRRVARARIGLGAVGPTPLRAGEAEQLLVGSALDDAAIEGAAAAAARQCAAGSGTAVDLRTRRDLVEALVRQTLRELGEAVV